MTIRWLHLSDVHECERDGHLRKRMYEHIVEKGIKGQPPPDLVFLTGDMAFAGKEEEYCRLEAEFISPLKAALPSNCPIFTVPGNHDVDRDRALKPRLWIGDADESKAFQSTDAKGATKRKDMLLPRFAPYASFDRRVSAWGTDWLESEAGSVWWWQTVNGVKVAVVGINTAWLCQDEDDWGKLTPGREMVAVAIREVEKTKPDLLFVVGHHPLGALFGEGDASDGDRVTRRLEQANAIFLHGHRHRSQSSRIGYETRGILSLQAPSAYQAHDDPRWRNGLMWGEADPATGSLLIQPRQWNEDNEEYNWETTAGYEADQIQARQGFGLSLPGWKGQVEVPVSPSSASTAIGKASHDWDGWPYPGFSKFSERHWDIFCGRESKINEVFEALQSGKRIIALVGASGTGKSSLLRAGVIGRIKYVPAYSAKVGAPWSFIDVDVEQDVDTKAGDGAFFGLLADRFALNLSPKFPNCESVDLCDALRLAFADPPIGSIFDFEKAKVWFQQRFVKRYFDGEVAIESNPVLVIVINQAEYIDASADRQSFLRFIVTAGLCENVRVLMTLRDTMFGSILSAPAIDANARDLFKGIALSAPNSVELAAMISEPAEIARIDLQSEFVSKMLKDADEREGNALPLVAQCLHQLAKTTKNNRLTLEDYHAFSGLHGIVVSQAAKVESAGTEETLNSLFSLLVGPGPMRRPASLGQLAHFGVPEELVRIAVKQSLLEALSDGRFMLSHDALLESWPRLNRWLKGERRRLDAQTTIIENAQRWARAGAAEEIRLSKGQLELLDDEQLLSDVPETQRQTFERYKAAAKQQSDRLALVLAVNAGIPTLIYKMIDKGIELTDAELGEGPEQLRPQFWSAVTGREVSFTKDRSIFDDDPRLLNSSVTRGISVAKLAVLCGRVAFLRELRRRFADRLDLLRHSEDGGTILGYAAYAGRKATCDFLIDECEVPADLCDRDDGVGCGGVKKGMSAAGWAVNQGHNELAQYLHQRGSPLDFSTIRGWNRLSESVRSGDLGSVEAAIAAGFDASSRFPGGQTCIHTACLCLHPHILEYLIRDAGLDVSLSDDGGNTAYDYLLSGYDDAVGPNKYERLTTMIQTLVSEGLPIDRRREGHPRVLLIAAERGQAEFVRALVQNGATKEPLRDGEVVGPLMTAVHNHRHQVVEVLLAEGADPNSWDFNDVRPLHLATMSDDFDMVEILAAQKSIRLDARDPDGDTALMLACDKQFVEIALALIERGANPTLHNKSDLDSLSIALVHGNADLVRALLAPKLELRQSFEQASVDAQLGHPGRMTDGR